MQRYHAYETEDCVNPGSTSGAHFARLNATLDLSCPAFSALRKRGTVMALQHALH